MFLVFCLVWITWQTFFFLICFTQVPFLFVNILQCESCFLSFITETRTRCKPVLCIQFLPKIQKCSDSNVWGFLLFYLHWPQTMKRIKPTSLPVNLNSNTHHRDVRTYTSPSGVSWLLRTLQLHKLEYSDTNLWI